MQKTEKQRRPSLAVLGMLGTFGMLGCEAEVFELLQQPVPSDNFAQEGERLDFGRIGLNCAAPQRTYTFAPEMAVRIESVGLRRTDAFRIERKPNTPQVVAASQSVPIEVVFQARGPGRYESALLIKTFSQGRTEEIEIPVFGVREEDAMQADAFLQGEAGEDGNRQSDILFVIDDSASMLEEQQALVRNFASFIDVTNNSAIDYHIGVTTTDTGNGSTGGRLVPVDGMFRDRVVTRFSEPDPRTHFGRIAEVGLSGSGSERGMLAAQLALSESVDGFNAGFLRPDARLVLIFISDERDQSPGFTSTYAEFFVELKERPQMVSGFAIVGGRLEGCEGPGGGAEPTPRYHELVDRLGGGTASICTEDWAAALANISKAAFGLQDTFPLSQRPDGELQVFVDGYLVPSVDGNVRYWRYSEVSNSVIFSPNEIPLPGVEVRILYRVQCDG